MTKEKMAALLNGREYGEEITAHEEKQAKDAGLLIIFGYSDDCVEGRGLFHDETYDTKVRIDRNGFLPDWESIRDDISEDGAQEYFDRKRQKAVELEGAFDGGNGYSWEFKVNVPHAAFDIVEGSEKYCRGLVISMADLA